MQQNFIINKFQLMIQLGQKLHHILNTNIIAYLYRPSLQCHQRLLEHLDHIFQLPTLWKHKHPLLPECNCYCMGPRFVALDGIDETHFQDQNVQKQIHTIQLYKSTIIRKAQL